MNAREDKHENPMMPSRLVDWQDDHLVCLLEMERESDTLSSERQEEGVLDENSRVDWNLAQCPADDLVSQTALQAVEISSIDVCWKLNSFRQSGTVLELLRGSASIVATGSLRWWRLWWSSKEERGMLQLDSIRVDAHRPGKDTEFSPFLGAINISASPFSLGLSPFAFGIRGSSKVVGAFIFMVHMDVWIPRL